MYLHEYERRCDRLTYGCKSGTLVDRVVALLVLLLAVDVTSGATELIARPASTAAADDIIELQQRCMLIGCR